MPEETARPLPAQGRSEALMPRRVLILLLRACALNHDPRSCSSLLSVLERIAVTLLWYSVQRLLQCDISLWCEATVPPRVLHCRVMLWP